MSLNKKQKDFFKAFEKGKNVFLTGVAGTGKSFCLNELVSNLIDDNANFGLTATTGVAALNIGGSTIHSWASLGLGQESAKQLTEKIYKRKSVRFKIMKTKVLVIDEISMMSGELLDKLNEVLKGIKRSSRPFGGIQMVFSGDGLQLPPVSRRGENSLFFFESDAWKEAGVETVELDEQVRQQKDPEFSKVLDRVRLGDSTTYEDLINISSKKPPENAVVLYCLNRYVDGHNHDELKKLKGESKKFYADTTGEKKYVESLAKACPAPEVLELKKEARVMLLKNLDVENGLVNGSIGVVKSLNSKSAVVDFDGSLVLVEPEKWELKTQSIGNGTKFKTVASLKQVPLKLAYAITTHKSQGLTFDKVILDSKNAFDDGMLYVALSRVRESKNLHIKNLEPHHISANARALEFYGKT